MRMETCIRAGFLAASVAVFSILPGCTADSAEASATLSETEKIHKSVTTLLIDSEPYTNTIAYVGRVSAEDMRRASFMLPGKILQVMVKEGDFVTAGQALAALDTEDYELAVEESTQNIALLENNTRQIQNGMEKIKIAIESEQLKTGALEADLASQNILLEKESGTYATNIDVLILNIDLLKDQYEDAQILYEAGGISQSEYDNARIAYESAEKDLTQAQLNKDNDLELRRQNILNSERNIELQKLAIANLETDLKDAELKLESTRISIEQAQVLLKKNQKNIADAQLLSSIDGYVMSVDIKEGDIVSAAMPVITLRTDGIIIEASVPVDDRSSLGVGDTVSLVYADGFTGTGVISEISQSPQTDTRTYLAEIVPDNKDYSFVLGSLVDVVLTLNESEGFFIPIGSVVKQHGVDYVYEVLTNQSGDSYAALREVTLGLTVDDKVLAENITEPVIIVSEGVQDIKENDIILTVGQGGADE